MQNKYRAFTLAELLVPLAIIVVLGTLLGWEHHRKREGARKWACHENLMRIALGCKQYSNDYDEHYPLFMVTSGSSTGVPPYGWADALQPYTRDTQIYKCPFYAFEAAVGPTQAGYADYFYNANFMIFSKGKWTGARESTLGSSAQTIVFGDRGTEAGDARSNFCGDGTSLSQFGQRCAISKNGFAVLPAAQIHQGGSVFAYADGHVKWLPGDSPAKSAHVLSNGETQKTFFTAPNSGKATFSLLTK